MDISQHIEDKIIDNLNEAGEKLTLAEFESLAESIINYIDEIGRTMKK